MRRGGTGAWVRIVCRGRGRERMRCTLLGISSALRRSGLVSGRGRGVPPNPPWERKRDFRDDQAAMQHASSPTRDPTRIQISASRDAIDRCPHATRDTDAHFVKTLFLRVFSTPSPLDANSGSRSRKAAAREREKRLGGLSIYSTGRGRRPTERRAQTGKKPGFRAAHATPICHQIISEHRARAFAPADVVDRRTRCAQCRAATKRAPTRVGAPMFPKRRKDRRIRR